MSFKTPRVISRVSEDKGMGKDFYTLTKTLILGRGQGYLYKKNICINTYI